MNLGVNNGIYERFLVIIGSLIICTVKCQLTTDVLWDSCGTIICGTRNLHIQCEINSKILINNVTSGLGLAFDEISYLNLRRMCMGMSSCNPSQTGFCKQHKDAAQFNVSYACIKEQFINNTCGKDTILLTNKSGFITSPNYPAETATRNCKWRIYVPPKHYVHVFLHEVVPNSPEKCREDGGLRFSTNNNCENRFPTYPICSESSLDFAISACNTTEIWLPWSRFNMRFWLSYYVVETSDLRRVSLYDMDITCNVLPKDVFTYSSHELIQNTTNKTDSPETGSPNSTASVDQILEGEADGVDYVTYIGLAVGILVIVVIIVIVIIYIRCRFLNSFGKIEKRGDLSNSNSQTNCSEIQKRPLPDCVLVTDIDDTQDSPVLQQSYSSVADEIPRQTNTPGVTSPTYAEIEEYSETGMKPKLPLVNKRSVDNSKRKLPAKPDEAQASIYSEIEDAEAKDGDTEKSVLSKNKKNQESIEPKIVNKKKLSNASNIYDECEDVAKVKSEKPYMDMSHKKTDESEYVPHHKYTKDSKDKANQSKKCRVTDKLTNQNIIYADCEEKTNGSGKESGGSKLKKESVTSESDSDEDICMVENELYEPFESAKV